MKFATQISGKNLNQIVEWQSDVLKDFDDHFCKNKSAIRQQETKKRLPTPLTLESKQFILHCAAESLFAYLQTRVVPHGEWQALGLASLLNAMILSGFEDHCELHLNHKDVFAYSIDLCAGVCPAERVKFYQVDLVAKGFGCPNTLFPQIPREMELTKEMKRKFL